MSSTFERNNTTPTMAELQAMQKTALNRNIDKAGNISKIADNAVNYDQLGSRSPKAFKFNFFLHATETGI